MHFKLFPALFDRPLKIRFIEQEENERIELFLRRHFITNFGWIVISTVAFILPLAFIQLDQSLGTNIIFQLPFKILIGGLVVYYLLILAYVIESFLFWYFNIYIVTNMHLVDVTLNSLLSRSIIEIELDDIQSVSSQINGLIRSIYNFGQVIIKTGAEQEEIIFEEVPKPDLVADRIQDLRAHFI